MAAAANLGESESLCQFIQVEAGRHARDGVRVPGYRLSSPESLGPANGHSPVDSPAHSMLVNSQTHV